MVAFHTFSTRTHESATESGVNPSIDTIMTALEDVLQAIQPLYTLFHFLTLSVLTQKMERQQASVLIDIKTKRGRLGHYTIDVTRQSSGSSTRHDVQQQVCRFVDALYKVGQQRVQYLCTL